MSEKLPALTVEEWIQFADSHEVMMKFAEGKRPFGPTRRFSDEQKLHAVAALALHQHPARFIPAEVAAIGKAIPVFEARRGPEDLETAAALRSLMEKLVALMPPPDVKLPSLE